MLQRAAPSPSPEAGDALTSEAEHAAGLRALGNGQLRLLALEGGDLERGPQGGLGNADRDLAEEMSAVALEEGVLLAGQRQVADDM